MKIAMSEHDVELEPDRARATRDTPSGRVSSTGSGHRRRKRVQLSIAGDTVRQLDRLKEQIGAGSYSEVIARLIALGALLSDRKAAGADILIREGDQAIPINAVVP